MIYLTDCRTKQLYAFLHAVLYFNAAWAYQFEASVQGKLGLNTAIIIMIWSNGIQLNKIKTLMFFVMIIYQIVLNYSSVTLLHH